MEDCKKKLLELFKGNVPEDEQQLVPFIKVYAAGGRFIDPRLKELALYFMEHGPCHPWIREILTVIRDATAHKLNYNSAFESYTKLIHSSVKELNEYEFDQLMRSLLPGKKKQNVLFTLHDGRRGTFVVNTWNDVLIFDMMAFDRPGSLQTKHFFIKFFDKYRSIWKNAGFTKIAINSPNEETILYYMEHYPDFVEEGERLVIFL